MLRKSILIATISVLLLSACVSAPRGPAARLAASGTQATAAFSADVNRLASQLVAVGAQEAYTAMWEACQSGAGCPSELPETRLDAQRLKLAAAVQARARALDALGKAYQALAMEADYDAAADLRGATGDAIEGVNAFTTAIAAAGGPAIPAISSTIGLIAGGIAGIIGEQRQRERIIEGSRRIAAALTGLRDGLQAEARIFDTLADYLGNIRVRLRLALLEGGLISRADALRPLTQSIDSTPVAGAEGLLASATPAHRALLESVRASAAVEIHKVQARYAAAVQALTALIAAHRELEADRAVSLADIDRLIGHFTALTDESAGQGGE